MSEAIFRDVHGQMPDPPVKVLSGMKNLVCALMHLKVCCRQEVSTGLGGCTD